MSNDLVINSYEEQIKESLLKAQAVKIAGFDLIIEELNKRSINCSDIVDFFKRLKDAHTREELDFITIDELSQLVDDINRQVTQSLVSSVEVAGHLLRRSRVIALEKSPNGKVGKDDKYIKVATNLANEIQQHGISHGIDICIRNFCVQKMYQITYKEKIKERKIKLGIYEEEKKVDSKKNSFSFSLKINKVLKEIFKTNHVSSSDKSFDEIKVDYFNSINNKVSNLSQYK